MISRLLIASSAFLLATLVAFDVRAQSADDFFNGGAQFYISNNIPDALQKVQTGRKIYPDDEKLKKLEELLKQQQQQQSQQNQQQQNQQNQQSQSQQNKNSKNQQSKSQQQQNQPNQQQQNQQNQSNPQKPQPSQQQQAQQQQGQKNPQNQTSTQEQPAQGMTPEEAKHLLDAQKGNEQVLQYRPKGQPENQNPSVKDW